MFEMGYFSGSKVTEGEERILLSTMWSSLGGEETEKLPKEVIRAFLIAVEGVKITDGVKTDGPEDFGETKDGDFYPDCEKISKHFKLFYLNRIRYIGLREKPRNEKAQMDMDREMTFQPEISEQTENYAQRYRQRIADAYEGKQVTVLDILTAETNKAQWIEETKKELEEEERKNCTFKPKTNNYVPRHNPDESNAESQTTYGLREGTGDKCFDLYQLSLLKRKQKEDKSSEEVEFEKNKNELTFQPNLQKKKPKTANKRHKVNQRSVMDNIERMRRAREEREFKRAMTERGYVPGKAQKSMQHGIDKKPLQSQKPYNYTQKRTAPRAPEESTLFQEIGHIKEKKGGQVTSEQPAPVRQVRPPTKVTKKRKPLYEPPERRTQAERKAPHQVYRETQREEELKQMSPQQPVYDEP